MQGSRNMKIIKATIPLFLIVVVASCSSFISTPAINPTEVMETSMSVIKTEIVGTLTAVPTGTWFPPPPTPTYFSAPTSDLTPAPDQQVYTDPAGWYSIFFPAEMKPTDTPNTFSQGADSFETGYLPDMAYMSNVMNVCAWLANIELDPEQSTVEWSSRMSPTFESEPRCSVSTHPNVVDTISYQIFEIPAADPEHRYVYLKTNWSPFSSANGRAPIIKFVWLKPITPRQESTLAPLSDKEFFLWKRTAPFLDGASVTEYALPPGSDPSQHDRLWKELPQEALPDWYTNRSSLPVPTQTPTVEEQLKLLGYELIQTESGWKRLFRNGKILFEDVINVSKVYSFSTDFGPINTFIVNAKGTGGNYENSFLIQNDAVYSWEYNVQDPDFGPILYQNETLWMKATKAGGHIQILKSDQEVVSSFAVYTEPLYAVSRFKAWNGHWILGARDFLIQDGEIINKKLSFEEIFSWGLIAEKPVYLFRKGPRIGISYDGKILPLNYQNVARHLCCGPGINNPSVEPDGVRFFAKRDGIWYYVAVKLP
jgi:hypothetical protein